METIDDTGKAAPAARTPDPAQDEAAAATAAASEHPFEPHGATILATEYWSLLAARS
jgi:hypothetical protein